MTILIPLEKHQREVSEMDELTKEQKEKIVKLNKRFILKGIFSSFLYVISLFLANLIIIYVDHFYVNNPQFVSVASIGTALVVFFGLRGTVHEHHDILTEETAKILNEK